jgi:ferredoxin
LKKLHAYLYLGWHFLLHVLSKLFLLYRPGGLERVRDNFEPDGLTPLTEYERDMINRWQACIGCGYCEAICPELGVIPEYAKNARLMGPQLLAESALRDLSRADLALPSAQALAQLDGNQLEAICPVDIPLHELAEFLIRLDEATRERRNDSRKTT